MAPPSHNTEVGTALCGCVSFFESHQRKVGRDPNTTAVDLLVLGFLDLFIVYIDDIKINIDKHMLYVVIFFILPFDKLHHHSGKPSGFLFPGVLSILNLLDFPKMSWWIASWLEWVSSWFTSVFRSCFVGIHSMDHLGDPCQTRMKMMRTSWGAVDIESRSGCFMLFFPKQCVTLRGSYGKGKAS